MTERNSVFRSIMRRISVSSLHVSSVMSGIRAVMAVMMGLVMWSCGSGDEPQMSEPQNPSVEVVRKLEIKAMIAQGGRVMAQEDTEARTTRFSWETGDEIGVYTDSPNSAVTFTVKDVTDGIATLTGEIAITDGQTIHAVYPSLAVESELLTVQKGTLEDVGDCLLMTASDTYTEKEGMTLMFHHHASLMTFNLTFPQTVKSVTDLRLENALSRYSFTSAGVEVLGAEPINISGPLTPDENGLLAIHVVILPGSEFRNFNLTCITDKGDYRMPPMTSENTAQAGKNHRTSRAMAPYSPYEMALIDPSSNTVTAVEGIQHDHGTIRWTEDAGLTSGNKISICERGVWKVFHTLNDADIARCSVTLPDVSAGCTIDAADPTRNDWIVALCMGGNVSTSFDKSGADKPLYWATGNLVAIDLGNDNTAFRLATLAEMEASQTAQSPFRHNPDKSGTEGITEGSMWDMFLYGDPTGREASSSYTTSSKNIAGTSSDIARAAMGYPWRLPYVPRILPDPTSSTDYSAVNELWALLGCKYASANTPALSAGWLAYGSNHLFIPLAGSYYSSSWHYVGQVAYIMTGNVYNKEFIYIYADPYAFASSSESAGMTGPSAFNVRPVTD